MGGPTGRPPTDLIRSVSRALRVLEQVAEAGRPLPVKVIARRCELNLSTAYHLVRTLCYEGYLLRLPAGGYVVGPELAGRFGSLAGVLGRRPATHEVLRLLAETTGHTAYLAELDGGRVVIADVVEGGRSPYLEDLQVGLETAAHATALGKALLATLPSNQRRGVLRRTGLRPFTRNTPTEPDQVEAEISALRPGDVAVENGQYRDEVSCAGTVVPGREPGHWVAVGVSTRGLDLPEALVRQLRMAADDLRSGAR
jgi:DNA-binding IclR family transcriptional regulator